MDVDPGLTLEGLLTILNVKREYTAWPSTATSTKSDYDTLKLSDGDRVEIVRTDGWRCELSDGRRCEASL